MAWQQDIERIDLALLNLNNCVEKASEDFKKEKARFAELFSELINAISEMQYVEIGVMASVLSLIHATSSGIFHNQEWIPKQMLDRLMNKRGLCSECEKIKAGNCCGCGTPVLHECNQDPGDFLCKSCYKKGGPDIETTTRRVLIFPAISDDEEDAAGGDAAGEDAGPSGDAGPGGGAGPSGDAGPGGDAGPSGDAGPGGDAERMQPSATSKGKKVEVIKVDSE